MDAKGERGRGESRETGTDIDTLPCIKQATHDSLLCSVGTRLGALWGPKWEGNPKKRAYLCTYSDSLCCAAETTTTLSRNYTPVTFKNKSIKKASKTVGSRGGGPFSLNPSSHTHTQVDGHMTLILP